jgi:hypothetical protein
MGNLCATPAKEAGRGAPDVRTVVKKEEGNVSSKKAVKFDKETKDNNQDAASNGSMDDFNDKFNQTRERAETYAN